ncbi:DNA-binding transcriptional LysR family regulator [Glaciimonas immobilis]|uniref:DNA-binding transcriptional LysR family regulator n=1 Tax=Glaciimonas immobilis TaxID=728004 RepID=A0A840RNH3_9BURK|nr:DNA-binding transcriptional LysR family regulator [Glaciimonas immobilis]
MSTNDGEIALEWGLAGHGILLCSEWDVTQYLRSGRLSQVLKEWTLPSSEIFAVYPERLSLWAKVRAFIDFLDNRFSAQRDKSNEGKCIW